MRIFKPVSLPVSGRRTTYANVTATLALVVALSGTSYAAATLAKNSVGTPQLKNDAVTSAKVKDGTVKPGDLSQATRDLAASGPVTPGFLTGSILDLPASGIGGTNWRRVAVSGVSSAATGQTSRNFMMSPSYDLVVRRLSVQLLEDIPLAGVVRLDLVAEPAPLTGEDDVVLSCEIFGTSGDDRSCVTTSEATIPANRLMFFVVTVGGPAVGTTAPVAAAFNMEIAPAG